MADERHAAVIERREAWRGRIFRVDADRVRLPNGHETRMEVVRHPGSVVLLAMPDPARLVLVRQYRYAIDRWIWELPAGSLEPDEPPERGALRECEEEVGLAAASAELVGVFYPTPGFCDEVMNFYRLTGLAAPPPGGRAAPDPDEDLRVATFGLDEVRAMIRQGAIIDGKTALGVSLLDR